MTENIVRRLEKNIELMHLRWSYDQTVFTQFNKNIFNHKKTYKPAVISY